MSGYFSGVVGLIYFVCIFIQECLYSNNNDILAFT